MNNSSKYKQEENIIFSWYKLEDELGRKTRSKLVKDWGDEINRHPNT